VKIINAEPMQTEQFETEAAVSALYGSFISTLYSLVVSPEMRETIRAQMMQELRELADAEVHIELAATYSFLNDLIAVCNDRALVKTGAKKLADIASYLTATDEQEGGEDPDEDE